MVKTIQRFKVTPKEPDEVLVQRQLESWLDPGWCMTTPAGSESKVIRKRKLMLWWIGVLMLLGLVGLVSNYPLGGLIATALVLVIVIALVTLIQGIVIETQKDGGLAGSGAASLTDPDDLARFEGEGGLEAHCHEELKHNTRSLLSTPKLEPRKAKLWPLRIFTRFLRFVES